MAAAAPGDIGTRVIVEFMLLFQCEESSSFRSVSFQAQMQSNETVPAVTRTPKHARLGHACPPADLNLVLRLVFETC